MEQESKSSAPSFVNRSKVSVLALLGAVIITVSLAYAFFH